VYPAAVPSENGSTQFEPLFACWNHKPKPVASFETICIKNKRTQTFLRHTAKFHFSLASVTRTCLLFSAFSDVQTTPALGPLRFLWQGPWTQLQRCHVISLRCRKLAAVGPREPRVLFSQSVKACRCPHCFPSKVGVHIARRAQRIAVSRNAVTVIHSVNVRKYTFPVCFLSVVRRLFVCLARSVCTVLKSNACKIVNAKLQLLHEKQCWPQLVPR